MRETYFGVFNRKGELEAVKETTGLAEFSAFNLSQYGEEKPAKPVTRTVSEVFVVWGNLGVEGARLLLPILLAERQELVAAVEREVKAYEDMLRGAIAEKSHVPDNMWTEKHKAMVAVSKIDAVIAKIEEMSR